MIARRLNRVGIERFRSYLTALRAGSTDSPPTALLEDEQYSGSLPIALDVEPRRFISRYHVGVYLSKALGALPHEVADSNDGLWSWLSLFWFDSLCPRRTDGTRRAGNHHRHVASLISRHRYGHLLYGPYLVFRRHAEASRVLLSNPPHLDSHFYQVITSVQDLIANRGVLEAAALLYYDSSKEALKRGCQPSRPAPGTVRRFVRVLRQLDLTHDIYGMTGEEIVRILPAEFDAWKASQSSSETSV